MANIGSVLRDEIARVARKSTKSDIETLRKASAEHRRQVAALKRQIAALSKHVNALSRGSRPVRSAASFGEPADVGAGTRLRFSAKGFAKKRQQLGLSAADMARLLGVSALSVYKWESGKTRPRAKQVEAIASVRSLGKREAAARLSAMADS